MIIEYTKIPDVTEENIDHSKIVLADSILSNVYPLFDDIYNGYLTSTKSLYSEYNQKKSEVQESKKKLESLMVELKRVKKVSKLLDRISKMINSGLVYDGNLKHETVILLKVVNKLSDDKLDVHLRNTLKTITKRFAH
jgi:hypothetical protein